MTIRNVSFLGLGTMGAGMAANLLKARYSVCGFNRTPGRAEHLKAQGLRVEKEATKAVENAQAVLTCVADDSALNGILFDAGALDHIPRGGLLIECGTTSLDLTLRLDAACQERGIEFIDAPITGSKLGAEGGKLTFMVGGPSDRVERARPLFEAMGRHVVHAGERAGDGQRIKLCLNMTQAIVLEGVLEGFALAEAQGVSAQALAEVFENSAGKTGVGSFKAPYLWTGDFTPHFRLDLMQKDLHLALGQASKSRLPVPLGRAVVNVYDQAARMGLGASDFLATAKLLGLGPSED